MTKSKRNLAHDNGKLTVRKGGGKASSSSSKKKKKKNTGKKCGDNDNDWIASLAKDSASNNGNQIPSKEDRIRKREAKKTRKMQQKQLEQQQERDTGISSSSSSLKKAARSTTTPAHTLSAASVLLELSKTRIRNLSQNLQDIRKDINISSTIEHPRRLYYLPGNALYGNNTSKKRKRKWNEDSIQPRQSDYSGIGLARNSMYIKFVDPSYCPKLEEEFQEHIPGFYGKQRTKAMRKQTDGNMLWRRLVNDKQIMSKKLKGMSPDERVEALIDSGLM